MATFLQPALWNVNSWSQHMQELKTFIFHPQHRHHEKSYLKPPNYTAYHTNHPVGNVRGGTAIIIKNYIKHHHLNSQDILQATSMSVEDLVSQPFWLYLAPRYTVKQEQLEDFYNTYDDTSLQVGTTVQSIPTGYAHLFYSKDMNYSKRWKART
jgi:hypothetical protein